MWRIILMVYLETDLEIVSPLAPVAVCVTLFGPTLMLPQLPPHQLIEVANNPGKLPLFRSEREQLMQEIQNLVGQKRST